VNVEQIISDEENEMDSGEADLSLSGGSMEEK